METLLLIVFFFFEIDISEIYESDIEVSDIEGSEIFFSFPPSSESIDWSELSKYRVEVRI